MDWRHDGVKQKETIMLAKIGLFELVTAAMVMATVLIWAAILSG